MNFPVLILVAVACSLSIWIPGAGAQDFEEPPVLKASALLEEEFLKSDFHEVENDVRTSGLLNHYRVKSSIGPFEVLGTEMLKVRVREVHAIEALRRKRAPGAAGRGLADQVVLEVKVVGKVITEPVQSALAIPQGIGSFVKRAGSSTKNKTKVGGNYTGGPVRDWLQIADYKLQWADELGVNPYSDNEVLQGHLNRVSTSSVAGGLGLRILIPGDGLIIAADEGRKARELQDVFLTPPTRLFQENRKSLLAMGVPEELADNFLGSKVYNPACQAIIVRSLDAIGGIEGTSLFIEAATGADSLLDALFYQRSAEILAWYHRNGEALAEHRVTDRGFPVALSDGKSIVIPLYFDYASWTRETAEFSKSFVAFAKEAGAVKVLAVTPGTLSKRASSEISSLGFKVIKPSL